MPSRPVHRTRCPSGCNVFPTISRTRVVNDYILGADYVGRDLFSLSWRLAVSLIVGPPISLIIGVTYGSISGFFGGKVDNIMMRIVDVLMPSRPFCSSSC